MPCCYSNICLRCHYLCTIRAVLISIFVLVARPSSYVVNVRNTVCYQTGCLIPDSAPKCHMVSVEVKQQETKKTRFMCTNPTRREGKFGDWVNPLDVYDDLGLCQRFRFPRRELVAVITEFHDNLQYLASTNGNLFALVGGQSWVSLYFVRVRLHFSLFLVHWCVNCKAFWTSSLSHSASVSVCLSVCLSCGKLWRFNSSLIFKYYIIINANNNHFAVLSNKYLFSLWRL